MKPSNLKFPKAHKGRLNYAIRKDGIYFGNFGIISNEPGRIKASQLESIVLGLKRLLKKDGGQGQGKILLRIFPHIPVTKKPSEVRMGKGKGSVDHYVCKVQRGTTILEIKTNSTKALNCFKIVSSKLPISLKLLTRITRQ